MSSKGDFYKEFRETYTFDKREHAYKTLDKAKGEFPFWFGNFPPCERSERYERSVLEWFKKWFGDR